jgi:hypothetical protein
VPRADRVGFNDCECKISCLFRHLSPLILESELLVEQNYSSQFLTADMQHECGTLSVTADIK